ncbi:MAG: N-acetylglucosamine-6-phosphate deacetylase [Verrucomicrobiae bacterium]|nr:N-acetylglucosamine-6-phosphate deacetylase [Verrucomicrobiae bacterium]
MTGYFDIQVNGYGGLDFHKDDMTGEELHACCQRLEKDGVTGILATTTTDHIPVMKRRLERLVALRAQDPLAQRLIVGLHIEGPFLNENPGFKGAHPAEAMHPANVEEMHQLLEAGGGLVRLVTLAPERDPGMKTTRFLAKQGVVISAGHTDASLDDLQAGIDAGLSMFTHLGNGCPMLTHRHDNIVQRALNFAGQLWLCFIADGVHVPFFALKNYLKIAGLDRAIVTTDAVAPAGLGPGTYTFARWTVVVGEDMALWAPDRSHLVGSGIFMPKVEANLRRHLGLSDDSIRKLICTNPRRAFGLAT